MDSSQKYYVDTNSQNYAEYEHSAPELAPQNPVTAPAKLEGRSGHGHPSSEYPTPVEEPKRKKIIGLAPWMFFTLIALIVVIIVGAIVGAIVGVVLGTRKASPTSASRETSSQLPSSTLSQTPSSTSSGTSTATSSPLAIIDANYAGRNITLQALADIQQGPNLVVNMSNTDPWGTPDPWYGTKKCISILYSYGSTIRTFVACDFDGAFTLAPGNDKHDSHTNDITRQGPISKAFAIVSVVWGALEITDGTVYESLYNYKLNGLTVPFTNELFRNDTLVTWGKSGVIWYTEDNFSTFKGIFAREGANVTF